MNTKKSKPSSCKEGHKYRARVQKNPPFMFMCTCVCVLCGKIGIPTKKDQYMGVK